MSKCELCGKDIKKNSIVSDICLRYAKYDGMCWHWTVDVKKRDISYWKVCEICSDKVRNFLIQLKEAENE